MEYLDFKDVNINEEVVKTMKLMNKSKVALDVTLLERQRDDLVNNCLEITPLKQIIKPKGFLAIDVRFHPVTRVPRFVCDLDIKVQGQEPRFLTTISGACYATEIKLMDNVVSFGSVVVNSSFSKKVQINNLGDTSVRQKWNFDKWRKLITISPEEGTLLPQTDF